ncbi:MAG: DUF3164 family protein [Marinobacterium sp.]
MNHAVQQHIPEGYMEDARGRLVPISSIKEIDMVRHDLVIEITNKAKELQKAIRDFKLNTLGDIEAFIDLSAEKYGVSVGGKKGNVSLLSFDGGLKVQRKIADRISFDERLQAAKVLIDQCLNRWSTGATSELKTIVEDAFRVDKEGKIQTKEVLKLRRHNFDDPEWLQAMEAISDSVQITGTQTYVNIYERDSLDAPYLSISLNMAKL